MHSLIHDLAALFKGIKPLGKMMSKIHGWSGCNGKVINRCSHWKLNLYHPAHG